jgi:hypothetical protein
MGVDTTTNAKPDADPVTWLIAVEQIKQLKARYFRFVDEHRLDDFRSLFADNARIELEGHGSFEGADALVEWMRTSRLAETRRVSVHHGHMPEIELISDTTARGIWAMFDYVENRGNEEAPLIHMIQGYGHYHEEYEKGNGGWRISSLRLTRIRVDDLLAGGPPYKPVIYARE